MREPNGQLAARGFGEYDLAEPNRPTHLPMEGYHATVLHIEDLPEAVRNAMAR